MPEYAYVYILASSFKRLYIGITTNLEHRVFEHRNKTHPDSFTARYRIDRLVYFERFATINSAIAYEKVLKSWLRQRKIALSFKNNPTWLDLSAEWGQAIEPFREPARTVPEEKPTPITHQQSSFLTRKVRIPHLRGPAEQQSLRKASSHL